MEEEQPVIAVTYVERSAYSLGADGWFKITIDGATFYVDDGLAKDALDCFIIAQGIIKRKKEQRDTCHKENGT